MGFFKQLSRFTSVACFAAGFIAFGSAPAGAAPDPNFHIYIAYGQSNMGGTADAQSADKAENPRFKIFASQKCSGKGRNTLGEVYPAVPSLFNCGNTISIADWFGRTMADSMPDVTIGIIPVAVGGASIKLFDQDQYANYLSTAEDWLKNYAKEYASDGNVTKTIIDIAKKAQQVGVIKGFIFHQGETDGGYPDWPKIVKKTRDDILKALDMRSDTVPFVAGELLRSGCCYSDRVSKLPNTMDNTYYASSEGLDGNGVDRYHFGHDAYVTFGKRYAEQMLKAINRAPVVPEPQKPFKGKSFEIPGKIEAEDFDIPGVGSGNDSYSEKDSEDHGGTNYREGTGVDIYKKATGYIVGYNQEGEWLEYSVNVKEAGEYAFLAAVASANETSGFQMSLDGKNITEVISVPKNEGEDNYDDYNKVRATVNLPAGEHILRFTVTGSWMDVDYFVFGEDEIVCVDRCTDFVRPALSHATGTESYRMFDMNGNYLGTVRASGMQELRASAKTLVKTGGSYYVKSKNGSTMVRVTK